MTPQKFKPILFSTEMVQAILEGRKTQTRRIVKLQPKNFDKNSILRRKYFPNGNWYFKNKISENPDRFEIVDLFKTNIELGDILWVRESFEYFGATFSPHDDDLELCGQVIFNYKASENQYLQEITVKNILAKYAFSEINNGWKPSIHMPKEACRIFLKVKNVKVEKLQDISLEDCKNEGVEYDKSGITAVDDLLALESFMKLWDKINGKKFPWKENPFVWVYEFERIEKPENFPQ